MTSVKFLHIEDYAKLDIHADWPCLGGCGQMVPFPEVVCGKEGCIKTAEKFDEEDDRKRNKVDL